MRNKILSEVNISRVDLQHATVRVWVGCRLNNQVLERARAAARRIRHLKDVSNIGSELLLEMSETVTDYDALKRVANAFIRQFAIECDKLPEGTVPAALSASIVEVMATPADSTWANTV